jgi:phasin family protein
MVEETQSLVDMLKKFGSDLGLPKVDVDKLVDVHLKNLDALAQTAQIASEGAKSVTIKQKEIVESAFRETLNLVRDFKPTGNPQEILAKQTELARRAFDATIENTRDLAELVKKSSDDALAVIGDRIRGSITDIRGSFERGGGAEEKT